jgi:hypothetical protein
MDLITVRVTPVNPVTIPVSVIQSSPVTVPVSVGVAVYSYFSLLNKPEINGVTLVGNKSSFALGLASEQEAASLRSWVAYLSNLVGRIPLYNAQGEFTNQWAAVVGINDGEGVYNLKVDDSDIIPTPVIPAILREPTE